MLELIRVDRKDGVGLLEVDAERETAAVEHLLVRVALHEHVFEQLFADLLLLIDERTLLQKLDGDQRACVLERDHVHIRDMPLRAAEQQVGDLLRLRIDGHAERVPLAEDQIAALVRLQLPQPPLPGALLEEIADELHLILIELRVAVFPDTFGQDLLAGGREDHDLLSGHGVERLADAVEALLADGGLHELGIDALRPAQEHELPVRQLLKDRDDAVHIGDILRQREQRQLQPLRRVDHFPGDRLQILPRLDKDGRHAHALDALHERAQILQLTEGISGREQHLTAPQPALDVRHLLNVGGRDRPHQAAFSRKQPCPGEGVELDDVLHQKIHTRSVLFCGASPFFLIITESLWKNQKIRCTKDTNVKFSFCLKQTMKPKIGPAILTVIHAALRVFSMKRSLQP